MRFFYQALVLLTLPICNFCFAEPDVNRALTLEQAIAASLEYSPQLTQYRFKSKALAGEKQTASLAPGFQLNGTVENVAGSGEYKNFDSAEYSLSLSSIIELGGQRQARTALVTARQQEMLATQRLETLDLIVDVTAQFIRVAAIQEEIKQLQQLQTTQQHWLVQIKRLRQIGKLSDAELLRAQANLSLGEIALQQGQNNLNKERLLLSQYWGKSSVDFGELQTNFYRLPTSVPLGTLLTRLGNNADMELAAQKIKTNNAKLKQVQSQSRNNIEWSAGIRQLGATEDTALVLGLNLPLGTSKRNIGAITAARAEVEQAEWQETITKTQLESEISRLLIEQNQFINQANSLRNQVIPLLQKASALTAQGFERGAYSFMELKQAQDELTNAQFTLIKATKQAHLITANIDRLLGLPQSDNSIE